jgi:hypothetical protein
MDEQASALTTDEQGTVRGVTVLDMDRPGAVNA